jgi:hypothetical protein
VTIQDESHIRARFSNVASGVDDSDWSDVRRRARGRRRARLLMVAGLSLVAITAAAPTLGLSDRVVRLFESSEPAPEPVKERFALAFARPEMAPDVIASEARTILDVPANDVDDVYRAVLSVAPTKSGGYCSSVDLREIRSDEPGGGAGGCDRDRTRKFFIGMSATGPISQDFVKGPVLYFGRTHDEQGAKVRFDFQDGDHTIVPVVWVSKPIDAGFIVYPAPKERWVEGHRAVSATLLDEQGKPLRKQPLRWFSTPPKRDR